MQKIKFLSALFVFLWGMTVFCAEKALYTLEYTGNRNTLFCNKKIVSFSDSARKHLTLYSKSSARDMIFLAYCGAFGSGIDIIDRDYEAQKFAKEFAAVKALDLPLFEIISPDYCRVNLAAWKFRKLPQQWLFNIFCDSAKVFPDSEKFFAKYIAELIRTMPQFAAELKQFSNSKQAKKYNPAYLPPHRIVSTRYLHAISFLQSFAKLPQKSPFIIAIDGRAASGKTTFARQLALATGGDVIHMDDFFLPMELRTPERLSQAGGNVHYERFKTEVLPKLQKTAPFSYRRFDCSKMQPGEMRHITSAHVRIVEGAYSLHPQFGNYADLKVFFDISPAEQMNRIRKRNGERAAKIFAARWIPMEEKYIKFFNIRERADIITGTGH